jgi:DNA modification methylase
VSVQILVGDCRDVLRRLPDNHFHCVVTSPPYWGLRDYGIEPVIWGGRPECKHVWGTANPCHHPGQVPQTNMTGRGNAEAIATGQTAHTGQFCQRCGAWRGCLGLEPDPDMYVSHLVEIFREVRRVLRDDGTVWLNLGDCYTSGGRETHGTRVGYKQQTNRGMNGKNDPVRIGTPQGLKPKDLVGIPWMVAFALRADGWWLRSDVIWHKPNGMPESVRDRPTSAHEHVFLLSKSQHYFYDQDAIREPLMQSSIDRISQSTFDNQNGGPKDPRNGGEGTRNRSARQGLENLKDAYERGQGRNKRNVWMIPTYPFPDSHFATYPPALVELCIRAGTSEYGCCPECGAPWERVMERIRRDNGKPSDNLKLQHEEVFARGGNQATYTRVGYYESMTYGFRPTCDCYDERYRQEFPRTRSRRKRQHQDLAGRWLPRVRRHPGKCTWSITSCRVLDPFGGAGTTALVADRLQRDATLVEIKAEYAEMARARIVEDAPPMFEDVEVVR